MKTRYLQKLVTLLIKEYINYKLFGELKKTTQLPMPLVYLTSLLWIGMTKP